MQNRPILTRDGILIIQINLVDFEIYKINENQIDVFSIDLLINRPIITWSNFQGYLWDPSNLGEFYFYDQSFQIG